MPIDLAAMKTRGQSLARRMPVTVSISGVNYQATRSNLNQERAFQMYGAQERVAESISIAVADLKASFSVAELNLVTVDGKALRFMGYEYDAARVMIRLDLKAVNS